MSSPGGFSHTGATALGHVFLQSEPVKKGRSQELFPTSHTP